MSLEERSRMLGIEHQRAHETRAEPGRDPGVFKREPRAAFRSPVPRGSLPVGERDTPTAELCWVRPAGPRAGSPLPPKDNRAEPSSGNAAGGAVPARRGSEAKSVSATPVPEAVHASRYPIDRLRGR